MDGTLQLLKNEVRALGPGEGRCETGVEGVSAWRFTESRAQMPSGSEPCLYLVLDGCLRLHTPSGILDYPEGQYSISKIDTPTSGQVLTFSERGDFLALSVRFTANDVIAAALGLDNELIERITAGALEENELSAADAEVLGSVYRLLTEPRGRLGSEFLRANIMREVIYYLLCGPCGRQLLRSCANTAGTDGIYGANSWIKENFRSQFSVEELAEQSNMSVSQFHQKFKSAVGMGPLQCQKRLRLTEARRLMLDEGRNVTEASAEVGYESLSQFIRDYRRTFGAAPKEDLLAIRHRLKK